MDKEMEKTIEALKKHGFGAEYAKDRQEALKRVLELTPPGASVGVPGSATVRAVGAVSALIEKGHEIFDHWEAENLKQAMEARKKQLTADVLITSVNALSMTGELVNMDGIGNRVAPTIFGPGHVIIVAGKNKIAKDLEAARQRVKEVAATKRARELNVKTPCAKTGECTDCNAPARICRAEVILHRPPSLTRVSVIVVGEELGN